jgi:hypothetical protein
MLHTRVDRGGVAWIWYLDRRGTARQVKRAFTDLAKPDAFLCHAAGRCVFHMRDLVTLVGVVERLRRGSAPKDNYVANRRKILSHSGEN